MGRPSRIRFALSLVLALFFVFLPRTVRAGEKGQTLVLPLRTIGVSDTTTTVARDLLADGLAKQGLTLIALRSLPAPPPTGPEACDEAGCARDLAKDAGADLVVYGSLSRLGNKVIVRVHALRAGEEGPFYREQLPAREEEDLDRVMLRIAEGIASGRPNSSEATVSSVIRDETQSPRLRATRRGLGIRAGFLFPSGDSYGGVERLTSLRLMYKYETPDYLVETTTLTGFTFGNGTQTIEWHIFDLFGGRVLGMGSKAAYAGAGLGVHSLRVEGPPTVHSDGYEWEEEGPDESATTLSVDIGGGFLGLRTYDFQIVIDLRYHYVFEDFDKVDGKGKGAHGILLTFGTSR